MGTRERKGALMNEHVAVDIYFARDWIGQVPVVGRGELEIPPASHRRGRSAIATK
jgi:hypothetical protein